MEASRGSMCWLFWVLTYTHAFDLMSHPCLPNAVLDYYSRIWIYLRQAPIKLQIGRSMRPTQTPNPFWVCWWNTDVCCRLSCWQIKCMKTKGLEDFNSRHARVSHICLSKWNINACNQDFTPESYSKQIHSRYFSSMIRSLTKSKVNYF